MILPEHWIGKLFWGLLFLLFAIIMMPFVLIEWALVGDRRNHVSHD